MSPWIWYAVIAAVLYGAHQIFTRLAAECIGHGLGGFVVEASAALSILVYLTLLWLGGRWNQKFSITGLNYSLLTGIWVGAGTIAFFLLFQKGGPVGRAGDIGRRRCHHGHRRDFIFSRSTVAAATGRRRFCNHRIVPAAQIVAHLSG